MHHSIAPWPLGALDRNAALWSLGLCTWLAAVLVGMHLLVRYSGTPGESSHPPAAWPAGTALTRAHDKPTLLMFAHPNCPCTRAAASELARLVHEVGDKVSATVLLVSFSGVDEDWETTDLRQRFSAIPGVRVLSDVDAREAARFGARTSSDAMLFSAGGALLFHGGITPARGHEGDNEGRTRIVSLVRNGFAARNEHAVYGCPLIED